MDGLRKWEEWGGTGYMPTPQIRVINTAPRARFRKTSQNSSFLITMLHELRVITPPYLSSIIRLLQQYRSNLQFCRTHKLNYRHSTGKCSSIPSPSAEFQCLLTAVWTGTPLADSIFCGVGSVFGRFCLDCRRAATILCACCRSTKF